MREMDGGIEIGREAAAMAKGGCHLGWSGRVQSSFFVAETQQVAKVGEKRERVFYFIIILLNFI